MASKIERMTKKEVQELAKKISEHSEKHGFPKKKK